MSTAFLRTTLVIVATPGTGVLYTLAAGLSRGARASVVAAFGCTLGIVPHMVAAITGLAALLNASALAFQTLKYVGVAYLVSGRLAPDHRLAERRVERLVHGGDDTPAPEVARRTRHARLPPGSARNRASRLGAESTP